MAASPSSLRSLEEVAAAAGLGAGDYEPWGRMLAKVPLTAGAARPAAPEPPLVLVTAITPTPAGEGKTTTAIGLAQGLWRLGVRAIPALRQPSMGPVFGIKGGGTGGGRSTLQPAAEINLHATGDLHAIAAANNLLAALVDNHVYWGGTPALVPERITWRRCLDVNDRALRSLLLPARGDAPRRETGFDITAASETMAVFSLAASPADLAARLERIVVGEGPSGVLVTAGDLGATGALAAVLRNALQPNLAQTGEGTPAIFHGGPFGNIAHGCSSVLGTRLALRLADLVLTEAGFGADLGAEKFMHIKARQSGLTPRAAVLVATVRALKHHGGIESTACEGENLQAVRGGLANLRRHAEILGKFGLPVLVVVNRRESDTRRELDLAQQLCAEEGLAVAVADPWGGGGAGCEEAGAALLRLLNTRAQHRYLYREDDSLRTKLECLAREVYGAVGVTLLPEAQEQLARLEAAGYGRFPVCVAKTQYSLTDDPAVRGAPEGHLLTVRELRLCAGAGFVVAFAGSILTMPGLPRKPAALTIGVDAAGAITGVA